MNKKEIKTALRQECVPKRLIETQRICMTILCENMAGPAEQRTGFWAFLSNIFRHCGLRLWGLQILVLIVVCASILSVPNTPNTIALFVPLLILACLPSLFQDQIYGMCEIEAATRASGAQIILAKLSLAGAMDLICLSVILIIAAVRTDFSTNMFQLILYAAVPFLGCVAAMLWCIRTCKRYALQASICICLSMSAFVGALSRLAPKLYELTALGFWLMAFMVFTSFFVRELFFLLAARKEGKMYGIIA